MSSADRKLPVEPLSRAAWERVESGLFASLDAGEQRVITKIVPRARPSLRAARWRMSLAGLAAMAAGGLCWMAWNELSGALSTPRSAPSASTLEFAAAQSEAQAPEAETTATATARARIATTTLPFDTRVGDSVLRVAAQSLVHVTGDDQRGWLVELEAGRVVFHISPRRARPPFVVQAGDTKVSVIGTRFEVAREGAGARIHVHEGSVHVQSATGGARLEAGDTWPGAEAAPAPRRRQPARARSQAPARTRGLERQRRFERASHLEAEQPEAALRIYRELAREGAWAANALYAGARLELELGRTQRARALLRRYLQRHPTGANAEDARGLLTQLGEAAD